MSKIIEYGRQKPVNRTEWGLAIQVLKRELSMEKLRNMRDAEKGRGVHL